MFSIVQKKLKKIIKPNQLLILESTVYPGATMKLIKDCSEKKFINR